MIQIRQKTERLLKHAALVLVIAGFTSVASASISLDYLVNTAGATLQIGDKIFGNFTWDGPSGPAGITVTGIGDGSAENLYGISIGGALSQVGLGSSGRGISDWRLGYSVTIAPDSGQFISDIHQYVNVNGSLGSFVNVSEDVLDAPAGLIVASSHVGLGRTFKYFDQTDPPAELNDVLILTTPLKQVWIKKDIYLQAFGPDEYVIVSNIEQRFSQVPEPTTMIAGALLLLPFGVSTLRILRKRKA